MSGKYKNFLGKTDSEVLIYDSEDITEIIINSSFSEEEAEKLAKKIMEDLNLSINDCIFQENGLQHISFIHKNQVKTTEAVWQFIIK